MTHISLKGPFSAPTAHRKIVRMKLPLMLPGERLTMTWLFIIIYTYKLCHIEPLRKLYR